MSTKQLTTQGFKDLVFNYDKDQEWKFKGDVPAIIDFYADWCGPCKTVAPILDELAKEYDGKLNIYKVDTEAEEELSSIFGIQSIPTLLFIPLSGAPMLQKGAIPKNAFKEVIENRLLQSKES
ncbi:thioredoxin [Flavisolibacter tropicus]|uniref:Thioredoxin n=1 Tax=Flavisolibacter tropicus TaxID=1492898 RepID=A0A172TRA9_9BACT|nr:thioredoxin [Flavisolibacter tropicus]ANE49619.1 thioredoxin [Flavisolibacter tropicus]